MMATILALIAMGGGAWAITRFILWRDEKYLSTEEQIREMMNETSIDSETLWSLFDRLS